MVPVFLTVILDILAPDKPKDKTLVELKVVLLSHFEPEPLVIAERFHFHKRDQKEGEPLADFVAELRRLASKCQFGTHLDDALRDRFVCGLRNESIQKILLMEKALKFNAAVEKALQLEAAEVNTKAMKFGRSGEGTAVNKVYSSESVASIVASLIILPSSADLRRPCVIHVTRRVTYQQSVVTKVKEESRMRGAAASAKWVKELNEESDGELPLFRVSG